MPKTENLLDRLQSEARKLATAMQAEITEREAELEALRDHAGRWLAALNGGASAKRGPGRPKGSGAAKPKRSSPPVDWDAVLGKLPRAFTTADIERATPALKRHPPGAEHRARAVEPARGGQEDGGGEVPEARKAALLEVGADSRHREVIPSSKKRSVRIRMRGSIRRRRHAQKTGDPSLGQSGGRELALRDGVWLSGRIEWGQRAGY
jgi:hypothetical protein